MTCAFVLWSQQVARLCRKPLSIDGFGSYDDETQKSPIFNHIGSRGYFWFLLFQLFTVDEFDGTHHAPGSHPNKGLIIGGPGAYIPHPNHTLISYLGKLQFLEIRALASS
jgi:hypothetical protein